MAKKILWAHPFSLHDTSSGAAIEIRTMLEAFVQRGIEVRSLVSPVFDNPMALDLLLKRYGLEKLPDTTFNIAGDPIKSLYIPCKSTKMDDYTIAETNQFLGYYLRILNEFRPDLVITYCDHALAFAMQLEAKLRGISVVGMVFNGNYTTSHFRLTDLLLTDSEATAIFYSRYGLNIMPTGAFIDPVRIMAKSVEPNFITMINPVSAKGLSIVTKLAMMAEEELPDQKFLLVENRGKFTEVAGALHAPDNKEVFPLVGRTFKNIQICAHTQSMAEVYANTAILLAPSLWYESFCVSAAEALLNGIPVIASQSGGLPGTVGDGGQCLPVPAETQADWMRLPTDEEMAPWMEAIKSMLADLPAKQAQARESGKRHELAVSVERTLGYMEPLFAKQPGNRPDFFQNGMFR